VTLAIVALTGLCVLALGGCGGGQSGSVSSRAGLSQPSNAKRYGTARIVVAVSLTDRGVTLLPSSIPAGPSALLITNAIDRRLTLAVQAVGAPRQRPWRTGPLRLEHPGRLLLNLGAGRYRLMASDPRLRAATLVVARRRR
jgi:hypothetical protein